jgi:hypothetical protein
MLLRLITVGFDEYQIFLMLKIAKMVNKNVRFLSRKYLPLWYWSVPVSLPDFSPLPLHDASIPPRLLHDGNEDSNVLH